MEKFETKHTPGPWGLYNREENHDFPGIESFSIDELEQRSIVVYGVEDDLTGVRGKDKEQRLANVLLICAAPLLLSALIKAVEYEDYDFFPENEIPSWYDEAKSAIQAAISQPESVKP